MTSFIVRFRFAVVLGVIFSLPTFIYAKGISPVYKKGDSVTPTRVISLRKAPRLKAKPVMTVKPNQILTVEKIVKRKWMRVSCEGKQGYIKTDNVTLIKNIISNQQAVLQHQAVLQDMGVSSADAHVISNTVEAIKAKSLASARPIRVVVYELEAAELEKKQVSLVTSALIAEIRKLSRVSTMGMREIQAMLSMEEQKQLMGCSDSSCLAEIAGALGGDYLILGSIGKIGESTVFSIKRVNMQTSEAEGTVTRRMKGGSGEELLDAVGPAVSELFPAYDLRPGFKRGVASELVKRWNPPPLKPWIFWTSAGLTGAALIAGSIFGMQTMQAKSDLDDLNQRGLSGEVLTGEDLVKTIDRGDTAKMLSNVSWGIAAGFAVTSAIVYLFTDWQSVNTSVGVIPDQGLQVAISHRF